MYFEDLLKNADKTNELFNIPLNIRQIILKELELAYTLGQLSEAKGTLDNLKPNLFRDFINSL